MRTINRKYVLFSLPLLFLLFLLILSAEAQMLKTNDGTKLVGIIDTEKPFTITTRYGLLKVPLRDIEHIIEDEVRLKNSSQFFGKIEPQVIIIKTDYGELSLSTDQIVWLNFVRKEEPDIIEE